MHLRSAKSGTVNLYEYCYIKRSRHYISISEEIQGNITHPHILNNRRYTIYVINIGIIGKITFQTDLICLWNQLYKEHLYYQ